MNTLPIAKCSGILPRITLIMPSGEEHFVASGRRVMPLVGVSNLEPGDILGVTHAPLMCVPLGAFQHDGRSSGPSSGPPGVTPLSAVMTSPQASLAGIPIVGHRA